MRLRYLLLAGMLIHPVRLQAEHVELSGRVLDENNTAVQGARVSVRPSRADPASAVKQEAVSGPTGEFTVQLPSTGEYLVSAENAGYFSLRDLSIQVEDRPGELQLVLNHVRQTSESVNVTGAPSPVDLEQTSSERRLSGLQIVEVPYPVTRSLRSALRLMPGVVQDAGGDLHFDGGMENQVLYTLDGFNIGDPTTGRFNTRLSVEAVRSLDYSSGRYSPEFGKGSAGALAIQTESGDDNLRYSATNFIPGVDTKKGLHIGVWAPRIRVSGPIAKGRAWFAENVDAEYNQFVVADLPKGQDRTTSVRGSNLLRTQVNVTPGNILFSDFLIGYENAPHTGLGFLDPLPTTITRRDRQWFTAVKDQIYLARGTLLEVGYANNRTFTRQIPQGHELYLIRPTGRQGNYFVDSAQNARRDQLLANLFLPSFRLAGTHQIKTGADIDRLDYGQQARRTGYERFRLAGTLLSTTTFGGSGTLHQSGLEMSSYVLDAWRLRTNLELDFGVRQDWDELVRRVVWSPRFAATYAPLGWKKTKIAGGYATVYDATSLALFARPLDQYALTTYFTPSGAVDRGPGVTLFTRGGSHLEAPRYRNWSAGLEQRLPAGIDLSIAWLRKRGDHGFTYINSWGTGRALLTADPAAFGASRVDAVYGLSNVRRDIYDSAAITLHQSFGKEYEWMASYTRSRALSNAVIDIGVDQPLRVLNNFGPLGWDAPNRFLSWAYLPAGLKNWSVAYLLEARTGFPFSVQLDNGQLVGAVNSHRFPEYLALNFHAERRFRFRRYRLALRGGFNNITNHKNPTSVSNVIGAPNFLTYYGSEGRHFVFRLRWLGKE